MSVVTSGGAVILFSGRQVPAPTGNPSTAPAAENEYLGVAILVGLVAMVVLVVALIWPRGDK